MAEPLSLTTGLLLSWRYLALFPLLIIEGFFVTIIAGFLVSTGSLSFYLTLIVVVLGDIASDMFYYSLGHRSSSLIKTKWGKMLGLRPERLKRLESLYRKHGGKILIVAKLTNTVSLAAVVAAGLITMPFRRFISFSIVAAIPKAMMLLLVGYYFGHAYTDVSRVVEYLFLGSTLIIALLVGGWYLGRRLMRASAS